MLLLLFVVKAFSFLGRFQRLQTGLVSELICSDHFEGVLGQGVILSLVGYLFRGQKLHLSSQCQLASDGRIDRHSPLIVIFLKRVFLGGHIVTHLSMN